MPDPGLPPPSGAAARGGDGGRSTRPSSVPPGTRARLAGPQPSGWGRLVGQLGLPRSLSLFVRTLLLLLMQLALACALWMPLLDHLGGRPEGPGDWLLTALAAAATLLGTAALAGLINRPLQRLSFAASRIRAGGYDSRLDEDTPTREIREVNRGFNQMARELARVEEERTVMLAGISHDLRTPLARLRLEAEMSVTDEEARRHIAEDIEQLDATIDKFMDYARPGEARLQPVHLSGVIDREIAALRDNAQIRVESRVAIDTRVMADETELGRVFANLFENARRYGRSADSGVAEVRIQYDRSGPWVEVSVSDRGPGVPPAMLERLTTPFFRGDTARTAATGAGLGLAIVDKTLQRMGGRFSLDNGVDGGLVARLRLKRAA